MKQIQVNEKCEVSSTARLIGYIFETRTEIIFNFHNTPKKEPEITTSPSGSPISSNVLVVDL